MNLKRKDIMKKLSPKNHDWVYLNEEYEVCSSSGCCTIGRIYLDLSEDEWVFDNSSREDDGVMYAGEVEQISYLLNMLNKRDKLGKYKVSP